jgi:hypothetical protein
LEAKFDSIKSFQVDLKKGPAVPFSCKLFSLDISLDEGVYQLGQPGDVAGGVVGMDDPLRSGGVDNRDGGGQGFLGGGCIIYSGGFANSLYEGSQGGADMLIPLVFLLVLLVSLDGRFMMCQTAPPVYDKTILFFRF